MKKLFKFSILVTLILAFGCSGKTEKEDKSPSSDGEKKVQSNNGLVDTMNQSKKVNITPPAPKAKVAAKPYVHPKPTPGNPIVVMETNMGTIEIELFKDKAPISTANFIKYVEAKFYDGTIFHRIKDDFMIQGGGFKEDLTEKGGKFPPIKNEADNGLSNARGTIAMARTNVVDSATAQFFINVVDNKRLDHRGPGRRFGYAVFGQVIKGMEVADKIKDIPRVNKGGPFLWFPSQSVVIKKVELKK